MIFDIYKKHKETLNNMIPSFLDMSDGDIGRIPSMSLRRVEKQTRNLALHKYVFGAANSSLLVTRKKERKCKLGKYLSSKKFCVFKNKMAGTTCQEGLAQSERKLSDTIRYNTPCTTCCRRKLKKKVS